MRFGVLVGMFAVLFGGVAAQAQTVVHGSDKTVYQRRTALDFTDVRLEGNLDKPDLPYVHVPGRAKFADLIKLRANFIPELRKSVDQL